MVFTTTRICVGSMLWLGSGGTRFEVTISFIDEAVHNINVCDKNGRKIPDGDQPHHANSVVEQIEIDGDAPDIHQIGEPDDRKEPN